MRKILILVLVLAFVTLAMAAVPDITQLNYTPSPAIPGSTVTVLLQIENNQDSVETGVVVTIDNEYPFTIAEGNDKNIGTIQKYGKATAKMTIYIDPSAESKTYNLEVKIKSNENPYGKGQTFPIVVSGKEPVIKVVGLVGETLMPGKEHTLTFSLKNVGTSTAYDVVIELEEDRTITATGTIVEREITPLGAATAYIDKIEPGAQETGSIIVSVNRTAELKNYTLPITVSYRNSSGTRSSETSYLGFRVSGDVDLDSTLKETSNIVIAGTASEINIELFNKGVGKAEYSLVSITTPNGDVEKPKQFIGSLEPNDVDSFKTKITFDESLATGEQNIVLNVTYQDSDSSIKTKEIVLPIMVYSQADGAAVAGANPLTGIINIILIIIIIVIIWKGYKKFKK